MNKNKHRIAIGALSSQLMIGAIMAVSAGEVNVAFADEVLNIQNKNVKDLKINDVRYKALEKYGFSLKYDSGFAAYLKRNGVSNTEYEQYVNKTKKYIGTNEEKIYQIENLMYIFDGAIYTNPIVKSIYKQNLDYTKNKDKAWEKFKQGAIYDIDWLLKVYEDSLESTDMVKLYKYLFKKVPTKDIEADLNSKSGLIYGLYSGVLKRELTSEDRNKISSGRGYELLGLDSQGYNEYLSYIKLRDKINKYEISYIKEYSIHSTVRSKIKNKYGVDIYTALTDKQRLSVYNSSLVNFNYDDKIAQSHIEDILSFEGIINQPETNPNGPAEEIGGESDTSTLNPLEEEKNPVVMEDEKLWEYDYLGKPDINFGIFGPEFTIVPPSKQNNYTAQYYYNGKYVAGVEAEAGDKKYYYIKMGENNIITKTRVEKDFTDNTFIKLMNLALNEGKWKIITTNNAYLIFVNNAIVNIKREDIYNLKELNKELSNIDLSIGEISEKEIEVLKKAEEIEKNKDKDKVNQKVGE